MFPRHCRLLALTLGLFLVSLIARVATEQAPPGQSVRDGLVRSELSLGGRTAILAYAPDLKANDPAHQALLTAAPGAAYARVRIGQLETTGVLRIATVQLGKEGQAGDSIKYELWLKGASDGWQVEVIDTAKTVVGQFPLSRHAGAPASPNLVAALVPEDGTISRLVLRWGEYRATSDVEFANLLSRRIESPENRMPNVTVSRAHDEDTSVLSRARLLAQRNESAFVLPKGPRLSVSFQRTDGSGDRSANQGTRRPRGLWVDGRISPA